MAAKCRSVPVRLRRQQREGRDQAQGAEQRHADIEQPSLARGRILVTSEHHQPGHERHQLEAQHQGEPIAGEHCQRHRRHEQRECGKGAAVFDVVLVQRVERAEGRGDEQDQQEERGERIEHERAAAA